MVEPKDFTVAPYEGGYLVSLHKSFYSQTAVFSAAYKLTGKNIVKITPLDDDFVGVFFEPKSGRTIQEVKDDAYCFLNEVLDQQVRVNLEQEFGYVRDVIVEHAFSPVKKNR